MTPETYSELLKDLQKREKTLVPAYLAALRADPALTERFQARFTAAEIGGRFDDFAMLCCRRSAVQFLLRTVYVRVLEDLGALEPPRIRGDWGFAAFREVAPALGVREFLKYTFHDLAHDLPALFTPSAEELPLPSEDLCRETWDLWHRLDGDRPVYAWTSDTFESRFLGDLYQDLDAEVRKRFALLQTPVFVEKYILDHTLTPALVEFDPAKLRAAGDAFRLIDPTCGSGHFLIGAFHRLADYWQAHGVPDLWEAAQRALESVWGCDINPHAVDIARFRLMLEVRARTGVTQLDKLASLAFNLRVMDSLIPWERGVSKQGELFPAMDRLSVYATPGERAANAAFLDHAFHALVGNPPYITPKDPRKRDDYRLFWPNSANGKYALSAPFAERFIVLGTENALIGQITSNSFMKREFGRALAYKVFSKWLLRGIIDTSGAYIPGHGTPTAILLLQKTVAPKEYSVWSILGKRGEPSRPKVAEEGLVWQSIARAGTSPDDASPFVTVAQIDASAYAKHPWSIGGGLAQQLLSELGKAEITLATMPKYKCRVGNLTNLLLDDVYMDAPPSVKRDPAGFRVRLVQGEHVRDWDFGVGTEIIYPYVTGTWKVLSLKNGSLTTPTFRHFWRFREFLWARRSRASKFAPLRALPGASFFEYPFYSPASYNSQGLCFAFVATHNHFAISSGGLLFNRTAPLIRFPERSENKATAADEEVDDDDTLSDSQTAELGEFEKPGSDARVDAETLFDVAGLLNSSTLGCWMKQVFHNKGASSGDSIRSEDWEPFFEYDRAKISRIPLATADVESRSTLARALTSTARRRAEQVPSEVLSSVWKAAELELKLSAAEQRYIALTHEMVAMQEELDWLTYASYNLIAAQDVGAVIAAATEPVAPGHRPFEILMARADEDADDDEKSAWWSRNRYERAMEIPAHYSEEMRSRIQMRMELIQSTPILQFIEQPAYKRRWQIPDVRTETHAAAESYLLDRLEDLFATGGPLARPVPYRLEQIVDAWARNPKTVAVARIWKGGDLDLTLAAEQLLRASSLPDNPYRIYTVEGIRTVAAWKHTWHLQDLEDQGKPLVDPDTGKSLIDPDTGKPLKGIPLPPKFDRTHFQSADAFSTRGRLNVPRERFILFADLTPPRYGWNGWQDTERALAQIAAYELAERDPENPLPPPTTADPRRCGPTLGLWESLPDVKRWGDEATHAEFLSLAQEVCSQKTCPCTVLESWQAVQQQARAKRPGRKGSLPVVQFTPKPAPPPEPTPAVVSVEDRGLVFRDLLLFGDGGATQAELARKWTRDPEHLTRVLDDLIASGDLKTRGRGRKKTFIATAVPGAKET